MKSLYVDRLHRLHGLPEIKLLLLIQPTLSSGIESHRQSDRHFRTDAGAAIQYGR